MPRGCHGMTSKRLLLWLHSLLPTWRLCFNPAFGAQESEQALEHFSKPLAALQRIKLLLEWQFLTMRVQTAWMHSIVDTVFVTGGAAVNGGLRQVIADVFAAKVCRLENTNSSCLGAALRAADAACGEDRQRLTERFCRTLDEQPDQPNPQRANAYRHDGFACEESRQGQ